MALIVRKAIAVGAAALAFVAQSTVALAQVLDGEVILPVPEPETLALLAIGAVALIASRWARRK